MTATEAANLATAARIKGKSYTGVIHDDMVDAMSSYIQNKFYDQLIYGCYTSIFTKTSKEKQMEKAIVEVYEKTKDAVLVNKYFGRDMPCDDTYLNKMFLLTDKDGLLKEAKRREVKANK